MKTASGLNFYHVSSAFQKCVRRGLEHEALWFGTELFISGYAEYAWYRIMVMASEDIGLADPQAAVVVQSLYQNYLIFKAKKTAHQPEKLPFTNALLYIIRAKKSRLVDNKLCVYFFQRHRINAPEIPDFAFDMHTVEGKRKGRGNDYFYEESAKIENDDLTLVPDEYEFRDFAWELYKEEDKEKAAGTFVEQPTQKIEEVKPNRTVVNKIDLFDE